MYAQRKKNPKFYKMPEKETPWTPSVLKEDYEQGVIKEDAELWYAAVDDIADGTVRMEFSKWPILDAAGRLSFRATYEHYYGLDELQKVINKARSRHNQPLHDRAIRVGDAFCIQGTKQILEKLLQAGPEDIILDITSEARKQAKIAFYAAASRKLKLDESKRVDELSKPTERFVRGKTTQTSEASDAPKPSISAVPRV